MSAKRPEDCDYLVAEYINAGNVEAAGKPRMEMKVPIVIESGELALTVSDYTVTSTGPDGK